MPEIGIPTVLISFVVFTVSCFEIEYALGDTVMPVIVIVVGPAAAILLLLFVKGNGPDIDGVPLYSEPDTNGVPENKPDGNVIVTVSTGSLLDNPPGTVKLMASWLLAGVHTALPLTRPPAPDIHFPAA